MIKEGPGDGVAVPGGSIVICWECRRPLFVTQEEIFDDTNVEGDKLTDIRSGQLLCVGTGKDYERISCVFCGDALYKNRGQFPYIAPPDTLGTRMYLFMIGEDVA